MSYRLERLEPRAVDRRVDPDAFGGAVIDGREDHHLATSSVTGAVASVPLIMFGRGVTMVPS